MATEVTGGVRLGEPAPGWTLPTLDGRELALDALHGRKVLLFFWGSW